MANCFVVASHTYRVCECVREREKSHSDKPQRREEEERNGLKVI